MPAGLFSRGPTIAVPTLNEEDTSRSSPRVVGLRDDVAGGGDPVAALRYIDPSARWAKYDKVLIAPVTFWGGDETKISPADQHELADFFTQTLHQQLSTKFQVVIEPAPDVLTIQVGLVDPTSATPVLRTVSMVIPQARGLSTLKYLATGTYAFVDGCEGEAKIMDSMTHQVLVAGVDKRVGGGSLATAAQWKWGDTENAMTAWEKLLTDRLWAWKSGTPPPA